MLKLVWLLVDRIGTCASLLYLFELAIRFKESDLIPLGGLLLLLWTWLLFRWKRLSPLRECLWLLICLVDFARSVQLLDLVATDLLRLYLAWFLFGVVIVFLWLRLLLLFFFVVGCPVLSFISVRLFRRTLIMAWLDILQALRVFRGLLLNVFIARHKWIIVCLLVLQLRCWNFNLFHVGWQRRHWILDLVLLAWPGTRLVVNFERRTGFVVGRLKVEPVLGSHMVKRAYFIQFRHIFRPFNKLLELETAATHLKVRWAFNVDCHDLLEVVQIAAWINVNLFDLVDLWTGCWP